MKVQIHTHPMSRSSGAPAQGLKIIVRTCLLLLILAPALCTAKVAHSAASDGPWLAALQKDFVVLDVSTGDLDGDGGEETAVCYSDPAHPGRIGIVVLKLDKGSLRPAFHVVVPATCSKIKIQGGRLGLKQEAGARGPSKVVWKYGTELVFHQNEKHPLYGSTATASSELGPSGKPSGAIDLNLATSWAEGGEGTGIGESITVKLPNKMHVAYIGVYGGHGGGERAFYDYNRIHRASLKTQTAEDLGDDDTGIDFGDLGLEIGGDRLEFSLANKPGHHYVEVDKRDVVQLELRVESVYLGRRKDDTHIAELEVIPLLSIDALLKSNQANVAKSTKKKTESRVRDPKVKPKRSKDTYGERGKKAVEDLDATGRSIVSDDF